MYHSYRIGASLFRREYVPALTLSFALPDLHITQLKGSCLLRLADTFQLRLSRVMLRAFPEDQQLDETAAENSGSADSRKRAGVFGGG